jgi:transposase
VPEYGLHSGKTAPGAQEVGRHEVIVANPSKVRVGALTALVFVLIIGDLQRFARSRSVGAFIGLVPACRDSGGSTPQLPIRQGDGLLRRLLVQASHYILGRHGEDSDLKRFGLKLAQRGGKNGKKRAVIAMARKLAVLLHRLWVSEADYVPLYQSMAA